MLQVGELPGGADCPSTTALATLSLLDILCYTALGRFAQLSNWTTLTGCCSAGTLAVFLTVSTLYYRRKYRALRPGQEKRPGPQWNHPHTHSSNKVGPV